MGDKKRRSVTVRIVSKPSRMNGRIAKWYVDDVWIDKNGNIWHLLEFYDGFRCRFPRDEFEEVAEKQ